jgi:hypothetical protein
MEIYKNYAVATPLVLELLPHLLSKAGIATLHSVSTLILTIVRGFFPPKPVYKVWKRFMLP